MIDRVRGSAAGIDSAACRMPCLQTWSRSDRRISPSRWEQAGRTDCGEQPGQEQSAAASLEPGLTLTGQASAPMRPDVRGRHLFFIEDGTTGIVGSAMFFFDRCSHPAGLPSYCGAASPVSDPLGKGVDVILAPMSSSAYLREIRRRLDPALVAYTSDPESRLALDEARGLWRRDCIGAGAEDCPETRAATISVLTSFVSGSESAEDMRDRAATMIMALMDDGKDRQD